MNNISGVRCSAIRSSIPRVFCLERRTWSSKYMNALEVGKIFYKYQAQSNGDVRLSVMQHTHEKPPRMNECKGLEMQVKIIDNWDRWRERWEWLKGVRECYRLITWMEGQLRVYTLCLLLHWCNNSFNHCRVRMQRCGWVFTRVEYRMRQWV